MKSNLLMAVLVPFFLGLSSLSSYSGEIGNNLTKKDNYTLISEKNLLTDYSSYNDDGSINIVVEIPTGSVAKWELNKDGNSLKWKFKKGRPREVKYLGYPGNYGMIPRTLLPKEDGGDGDPLDVIVLGPAIPRGNVIVAKLIGILRLLDKGEQDDKLIAVVENTSMYEVNSIKELDSKFIGVSNIIETWFVNYKGPGKVISSGFGEKNEAERILQYASAAYEKADN